MTVKELRALLAAFPDDALVVLARDLQGHQFVQCGSGAARLYRPATWICDAWLERESASFPSDPSRGDVEVLVLYPVPNAKPPDPPLGW